MYNTPGWLFIILNNMGGRTSGRERRKEREKEEEKREREREGVRRDWREGKNLTKQHVQLTDVSKLFTHVLLGPQSLLPDDGWPV